MAIAITYKEPRLYQILAQPNVLSNENVGSIYEVAKENNLEAVSKVCFNYLNKYFNTIVRDQNVVSKWSPAFVKELLAQFEAGTSKYHTLGVNDNWLVLIDHQPRGTGSTFCGWHTTEAWPSSKPKLSCSCHKTSTLTTSFRSWSVLITAVPRA